jgi:Ala-tRNA(Pro) deacylase
MQKKAVIEYLDSNSIEYDVIDHDAIFTITQLEDFNNFPDKEKIAKNLFLRNDRGKKHYLVLVRSDKTVDLKDLRRQINSSRLSFASEERLMKHLKLTKGSVSPLAIINDNTKEIPVYIDKDLMSEEKIGVHPNINTSTIWISHDELVKAIKLHGNPVMHVAI